MKTVRILLVPFLLIFFVKINGQDLKAYKHVTSTIGAVNVTFTWTIKNFSLTQWELSQNPEIIDGPTLEDEEGRKVTCNIHPYSTREHVLTVHTNAHTVPQVICKFNPQPMAVKYSFESNGETINHVLIGAVGGDNDVKITIDAFYSKNEFY